MRMRGGSTTPLLAALLSGALMGAGCASLRRSSSYAADKVRTDIRQDFARGLYFGGTAHVVLAPLTFALVLLTDPAARNPPEPRPTPPSPREGS